MTTAKARPRVKRETDDCERIEALLEAKKNAENQRGCHLADEMKDFKRDLKLFAGAVLTFWMHHKERKVAGETPSWEEAKPAGQ